MISLASATTTVTLNSPEDNNVDANSYVTFNCSAETSTGFLTNISLYTNSTGSWSLYETNYANEFTETPIMRSNWTGGIITSSMTNPTYALDNDDSSASTHSVTNTPSFSGYEQITFTSIPINFVRIKPYIQTTGGSTYSCTNTLSIYNGSSWNFVSNTFSNNTEQNITLSNNISVGGLRFNYSCDSGDANSDGVFSLYYLEYSTYNYTTQIFPLTITSPTLWSCQSCNNNSECSFASANRTVSSNIFINSINYSSTVYETEQTSYWINLTANLSLTSVKLYLNGTSYTTSHSGDIWNYTVGSMPSSRIGNNSIIFGLMYAGQEYNTTTSYQTISPIQFGICNATLTVPYWNISFKDESTLSSINGTLQGSTFVYYLGNGTINKTLSYSVTTNSSSYRFCSLPADRPYYVLPDVNYLLTGYPTRIYNPSLLTLTNSTTNTTLYLLSSADGIYVTFITATTSNTPISGVDIEITRVLGGSTTTIFSGLTDSAGSVTVWLNPNYDHTITASKSGYTTNTQTIKPTQSQYTLTMETALDDYEYVADRKGLKWFAFPGSGVIKTTNYTLFGYNVSAKNNNLVSCKLELLNSNKTIIITSAETFATNNSLCSVSINYSMNYTQVKGRLLVDLGDGYKILEDDAKWRLVQYNTTGMTMIDWFRGLDELEVSYFNNDEQHREYTYILLFFLVVMIICAVLNRMGWDIQTNGGMIFLVGILVWAASVPGFLTLSDISPFAIIDRFFVAIIYTMFMIGFAMRELT